MSAPSSEPPAGRHWKVLSRVLVVLLVAAAIAAFYLSGLYREFDWNSLRAQIDQIKAWVDERLVLATLAFAAIYVAITALSLPVATALSLIAGALFGRWLGTGIVVIAATSGATLAFLGSRFVFREFVERRFGRRLRSIQEGVERDGAYYLFTLRLVPLFPFFLINLAMGLTRMRVVTFAWVSLIGMLPGTFIYVNAGTEISQIDSPAGILSWRVIVALALLALLPLLIRFLARRLTRHRDR